MINYLYQVQDSVYNPMLLNVDHVTVFNGHPLVGDDKVIGRANMNAICTVRSISVLNAHSRPFYDGNTMSHEIMHSIGVEHDSDNSTKIEINCPNHQFLMGTASGEGGENGVWSDCTRRRCAELIKELDDAGKNCLLNKVAIVRNIISNIG